uniref:Uncharacterized protein n=1 Tax=viral metagenome TaxID=1070528 RepID=A0A6M3XE03_9ZZZZ
MTGESQSSARRKTPSTTKTSFPSDFEVTIERLGRLKALGVCHFECSDFTVTFAPEIHHAEAFDDNDEPEPDEEADAQWRHVGRRPLDIRQLRLARSSPSSGS